MTAAASPGSLDLTVDRLDDVVVVRAEGEIDLDNADRLAATLRSASEDSGDGLVLDLIGVPFMDSSGLKALLQAVSELGGRLRLVLSPGSPVARLLELAEVRNRFSVHDSIEAAARAGEH